MAKHKITIENNLEWNGVGNSMSTSYKYENGQLIIDWNGRTKKYPAKIGDEFIVDCFGGFPDVYKFQYPANPRKLINMAFGRVNLFLDKDEYNSHADEFCSYYCEMHPHSVGLYNQGKKYSENMEHCSMYQAEGTVYESLYVNPNMDLKEFKSILASKLGEKALHRVPDKGIFGEYLARFEKNFV